MASIVLTTINTASAYSSGGFMGALQASGVLNSVFGSKKGTTKLPDKQYGVRLDDLKIQTSTYGKVIPIIYGNVRIAGNIIWTSPIQEIKHRTTISQHNTSGGGKGGGGSRQQTVSQDQVSYSYLISLAIGICEGEITGVKRIWADSELLDMSTIAFNIYYGSEDQTVDTVMEAYQGVGNVPAYRDLAYIVFEDFPLRNFGNRIPNFTFEIERNLDSFDSDSVENKVTAVNMIPGSGEFVYDTVIHKKVPFYELADGTKKNTGYRKIINQHNISKKANSLVSLDQLQKTLPNVGWVSPVVTWFCNGLDITNAKIEPKVEYQTNEYITPDNWEVAGIARGEASIVTYDNQNNPIYGGSISDLSVIRYLDELKLRGYKIMFYPMLFVDQIDKPWRGRITGNAGDIANFFTGIEGYNRFILHYANLVKGKVDAFIIGSEMIGLTKIKDANNQFFAVNEFISLASQVKQILGNAVKVTYAADWSEYHHTEGGWYNLDPLWASNDIDIVGIDAYFPITDINDRVYDKQIIMDGWTSGEGYDWYYADANRSTKTPVEAKYAWKNMQWWWANNHYNPDGQKTAWNPSLKKIWFTEYGFPSIDKATNQPNVFYNPESIDGGIPRYSNGRADFYIQRLAIEATEDKWKNSNFIENKFIWTWDARPFPFWPDLKNIWSDGNLWKKGHWIQGKFGISYLATVLFDLCKRAGFSASDLDLTRIQDSIGGVVFDNIMSIRQAIEVIRQAYFFDIVESDSRLKFMPRGVHSDLNIDYHEIITKLGEQAKMDNNFNIIKENEVEIPYCLEIIYQDKNRNYQNSTENAVLSTVNSRTKSTITTPIIVDPTKAYQIVEVMLNNIWQEQVQYSFQLPTKYLYLEASDVISISKDNIVHQLRITDIKITKYNSLKIGAVAENINMYDIDLTINQENQDSETITKPISEISSSEQILFDLPALPNDNLDTPRMFAAIYPNASNWSGAELYNSFDNNKSYSYLGGTQSQAIVGFANNKLEIGKPEIINYDQEIEIIMANDNMELESVSADIMLNWGNLALLGDEIIAFTEAELIAHGRYILKNLLRGRFSTEGFMSSHHLGERFVLLNNSLVQTSLFKSDLELTKDYKSVSFGEDITNVSSQAYLYEGNQFKPYSPCQIIIKKDLNNDINLCWIRRSREGFSWNKGEISLSEREEKYQIEIYDNINILKRILYSNNTNILYDYNAQLQDFGGNASNFSVKIYQISDVVGVGYPAIINFA